MKVFPFWPLWTAFALLCLLVTLWGIHERLECSGKCFAHGYNGSRAEVFNGCYCMDKLLLEDLREGEAPCTTKT